MSWISKKKLERIVKFFARAKQKGTQIFPEDIEALKHIEQLILSLSENNTIDNKLFAKLLAVYLIQNVNYYGNIKLAIKSASEQLKIPISNHLDNLTFSLNQMEMKSIFNSVGIDYDVTDSKTSEELIQKNQKLITEKLLGQWKVEDVSKSFYNTTNDFIKDIEHYI